jgi:hypothetical protein
MRAGRRTVVEAEMLDAVGEAGITIDRRCSPI